MKQRTSSICCELTHQLTCHFSAKFASRIMHAWGLPGHQLAFSVTSGVMHAWGPLGTLPTPCVKSLQGFHTIVYWSITFKYKNMSSPSQCGIMPYAWECIFWKLPFDCICLEVMIVFTNHILHHQMWRMLAIYICHWNLLERFFTLPTPCRE